MTTAMTTALLLLGLLGTVGSIIGLIFLLKSKAHIVAKTLGAFGIGALTLGFGVWAIPPPECPPRPWQTRSCSKEKAR